MYVANVAANAMKEKFAGASAVASFPMSTNATWNLLGTALVAVSIFILRLCALPIRIMLVGILLTVLAIANPAERRWNREGRCPRTVSRQSREP